MVQMTVALSALMIFNMVNECAALLADACSTPLAGATSFAPSLCLIAQIAEVVQLLLQPGVTLTTAGLLKKLDRALP